MRYLDLTLVQQTVLIELARGLRTDSIGLEVSEIDDAQREVVADLARFGLVAFRAGWRGSGWYSLTDRGWRAMGM